MTGTSVPSDAARLRILDLRDTTEIGGPGKTILETFRAVDGRHFELHLGVFLTRSETDDTPFIRAARDLDMPVHIIRGYNQYDLRMVWRVARLVRELRIDIVHAHEVKSDVIALLASVLQRAVTVTTMHGWIGNSRKRQFMIALDKLVARGFDCVIAVSNPIRDDLSRAGVTGRCLRLLHNAIVLDRYQRTNGNGTIAKIAGRPVVHPVICSIGRLSPEKGQADLVDALALVAARGRKFTAVLAGDGPDRQALADKVAALGLADSVFFPGYVSRPQTILTESDLMVLPSHTEGLPNAALEALAMRVPVLATRVGGTPEVIVDNETGRLVNSRAPEELADGILDFLDNPAPWRSMADRGRSVVETQFSFDVRTRRLEAIYRNLVSGARA